MSDGTSLPELNDEQVARIDQNLALGFDFLRDVLHDPALTDDIPTGSTLAFRSFRLQPGVELRVTAFRAPRSRRWGVRVTGVGEPFGGWMPIASRWVFSIQPLVQEARWASADEAFTAVAGAVANAREAQLLIG
ncbi:MAG: hypothetical protein U0031_09335 [Thermomicrobiales bacterium]